MLWNKKIILTGFGILLSVFFAGFVSSSSYAINDLSVSFNTSSDLSTTPFIFPDCDRTCYSQYSYLIINIASSTPINFGNPSSFQLGFVHSSDGYYHQYSVTPYTYTFIYYILSDYWGFRYGGAWGNSHYDITFTLSTSLPSSDCPEPPSAVLNISSNGSYDVSDYAEAVVNVPQVSDTPYDDKLDKLIVSVYVVAGTMLVIYFFYCIYRLIIKGVK